MQLPILCVHVCIVAVGSAWLNGGVGGSELNMDTLPFTFLWLVTCSSLSLSLSLPLPLSCPHSLSPSLPPFLSLSLSETDNHGVQLVMSELLGELDLVVNLLQRCFPSELLKRDDS